MSSSTAPSVSLRFSLVDNPRTQIEEWFEDIMAQARRLCIQWDITGAITLVASDSVWNAVPGNITNTAQVLAGSHPPAYRPRPDFDPPVALDPAATAVELANWKLEMDMHFAYTLALNSLSLALLASVGPVNTTLLKVAYTPTPLHFLTPRQIIDCMFTKHASLTGPDLKKLRAPLFEPLQAVAELEAHMGKFVLASIKLSATGHGEDSYRYFELFLESIKGFPLISTTLDGFYQRYPTVPQQNITSLFGYLEPMVSHLIEQTGSAPFSGGAITPKAPTPNPNRRKKVKGKQKGQWGSWANEGAAAHLAGGVFQAQTPPTSLTRIVRRGIWPRSNASRLGSTSATHKMHFLCSTCMLHSKMAPRLLVLARIIVECMVGTTTTMAPSAAEWPATSVTRRPCALQQHMWARGVTPRLGFR